MKLNLRVLVYLNPSNIDNITHKFMMDGDSGFQLVKNTILALNKIEEWHFYVLVPPGTRWDDQPNNVSLWDYPYVNDALNSRYHFDTNAILGHLNTYQHDIDLIWTMQPEHAGSLRALANKRREEIPVFSYINWLDYHEVKGYEPSYRFRILDGIENSHAVGIQSQHMLDTLRALYTGLPLNESRLHIIAPKTYIRPEAQPRLLDRISFPHRVSQESGFSQMWELVKDCLKMPLHVSNLNNKIVPSAKNLVTEFIPQQADYREFLSTVRFGVSYHVGYSMWSMSVLDLMAEAKVVLVPRQGAFLEMMPSDYPFFFSNDDDFRTMFSSLQECSDDLLTYWGTKNQERVRDLFTWEAQARDLSALFYSLVGTGTTDKTPGTLEVIQRYSGISKTNLINKNLTPFSRRCSRAWNKARIELMRDYGVRDDTRSSTTIFYTDADQYRQKGPALGIKKVKTPWEHKLDAKKAGQWIPLMNGSSTP